MAYVALKEENYLGDPVFSPLPEWYDEAPCIGLSDLFFPPNQGAGAVMARKAKAICATCPFTEPCLEMAMEDPILLRVGSGIWGGTSAKDRQRLSGRWKHLEK